MKVLSVYMSRSEIAGSYGVWRYLRKLNRELPYGPAIPLLGIYLNKAFLEKDTCIPVFTAVLFTIAKT